MGSERHRGPKRRQPDVGKFSRRADNRERPEARCDLFQTIRNVGGRRIFAGEPLRDPPERAEPQSGSRERGPNPPTTTLGGAPDKGRDDPEGEQLAGRVIERLQRQRPRRRFARGFCLGVIEAARGLYKAVETAAPRPRAVEAVCGKARADDARPDAGDVRLREAAPAKRARSIGLQKHVSLADQLFEVLGCRRFAQIEERRQLAAAGVDDERRHLRQVRRVDQQHIGAVAGECPSGDRPGDDAREIEYSDAGERRARRLEWFGWRLAEAFDRHQRLGCQRLCFAAPVPFGKRPEPGNRETGFGCRAVEFFGPPVSEGARYRRALACRAEQLENPVAMMRKVGVQPHPAIGGGIEARDRIPERGRGCSVDPQVALGSAFEGGIAERNGDGRRRPAAQPEKFACGQSSRADARRRRSADGKARGQYGIGAAEADGRKRLRRKAGASPDLGERCVGGHGRSSTTTGT